jgi:hypothetical protein
MLPVNRMGQLRLAAGVAVQFAADGSMHMRRGEQRRALLTEEGTAVLALLDLEDASADATSPTVTATLSKLAATGWVHHAADESLDSEQSAVRVAKLPQVPSLLGRYQLLAKLQEGSHGIVYRAHDPEAHGPVAIKVMRRFSHRHLRSFRAEARRLALLAHPNIVAPLEFGVVDELWFFSMELVDGSEFVGAMRPDGRVDNQRLRAALAQLTEAIAAVHQAGLMHLDLKPANVLVRHDGRVAVLDFGVSHPAPRLDGAATKPFGVVGTPAYMPPEMIERYHAGPATDWYAVGVMLYEALTGQRLFRDRQMLKYGEPVAAEPDVVAVFEIDTDPDLRKLCLRLLDPNPQTRAGADELRCVVGGTAPTLGLVLPFVGRAEQLDELMAELIMAEPGAKAVAIRGRPGAGKTRFVEKLVARLQAREPLTVLTGRCLPNHSLPFVVLDAVLEPLLIALESTRLRLDGELGRDLAAAVKVFPSLHSVPGVSKRPAVDSDDPSVLLHRAFRGFERLLATVADGRPLVLVLEDLHHADADSAAAIAALLSPPHELRLIIVATTDSERVDSAFFDAWAVQVERRDVCFSMHELAPLAPAEARQLVGHVLGDQLDPSLLNAIAEASAGIPYLIELIGEYPALASVGALDLESVVAIKLEELPDAARAIVDVLAIAETSIEVAALRKLCPPPEELPRWLHLLHGKRMLRASGYRSHDLVRAYHPAMVVGLRARLDEPRRCRLHRELGAALLELGAAPARVGQHFAAGGELERAAEAFLAGAERAFEGWAFETAADLYRRALDCGTLRGDTVATAARREADALRHAGRTRDAAEAYLRLAGSSPIEQVRSLYRLAVENFLLSGRIDSGLQTLAELRERVGVEWRSGATRSNVSVLYGLLWLRLRGVALRRPSVTATTNALEAIDLDWSIGCGLLYVLPLPGTAHIFASLRGALRCGDRHRVARALALVGAGLFSQIPMLSGRGRTYLQQAEALAEELEDPMLRATCRIWSAFAEVYPGHFRAMGDKARAGLEALTGCPGGAWERVVAQLVECTAALLRGRMREVEASAGEYMAEADVRGDLYGQVVFRHSLAFALVAAGRTDEARFHADWADANWTDHAYTVQRFHGMRLRAWSSLYEGDAAGAAAMLADHRDPFRRAGGHRVPMSRIDWAELEAAVLLSGGAALGQAHGLRPLAKILRELAGESRHDGLTVAELFRASLALRSQDHERARSHFEAVRARSERNDMDLHLAVAELGLARIGGRELGPAHDRLLELGVADPARYACTRFGLPHETT